MHLLCALLNMSTYKTMEHTVKAVEKAAAWLAGRVEGPQRVKGEGKRVLEGMKHPSHCAFEEKVAE